MVSPQGEVSETAPGRPVAERARSIRALWLVLAAEAPDAAAPTIRAVAAAVIRRLEIFVLIFGTPIGVVSMSKDSADPLIE